jgi:alkylhydroperoxidase/carboxymuconolactone decarboxylase family protein YurZ
LRDTLLQITVYCGAPAGVEVFRIADKVLADEGIEVGEA